RRRDRSLHVLRAGVRQARVGFPACRLKTGKRLAREGGHGLAADPVRDPDHGEISPSISTARTGDASAPWILSGKATSVYTPSGTPARTIPSRTAMSWR